MGHFSMEKSRNPGSVLGGNQQTGLSGGRIEIMSWRHYAAQGKALLEHLNISQALLMGGCMGCSAVTAFAAAFPQSTIGMVLFWPVGGARYRLASQQRFAEHLAYVRQNGLPAVLDLAQAGGETFGIDARVGPWASVLRRDAQFANLYVQQDPARYQVIVAGSARMFDRDTAPGPDAEELLNIDVPALIVPGADNSHSAAAARYLSECLSGAEYWDVPVSQQRSVDTALHVSRHLQTMKR
ncbi:MAG: alpha/beta hydrolase [Rhizobiaceae bacterium]|nr:alpha/beta hydrolase [Rhizobiaceae bacterium]